MTASCGLFAVKKRWSLGSSRFYEEIRVKKQCNKNYPSLHIGCIMLHMTKLEKFPFFTIKQAEAEGLSRRMLSYYVQKGLFEKVGRGIYRSTSYVSSDDKWYGLAVAASSIKNGVICLVSALNYYEISDDFMNEYWIAIPHSKSKLNFPLVRIVRMRNFEVGVKEIKLADMKVKIFDIERTIVDSFRLLDLETAIKALKIYLSGKKGRPNIRKLNTYAKELRVDLSKYTTAFTV